jgi:putative SOS response-associated peptidase YedK
MCYSVKYLKDKLHKYAKHHDINDSQIPKLFDQHYTSGFSHPDLAVITDNDPKQFHIFNWGLIPFWVKDIPTATKLSNQTLNARSETIFEKPSFRNSIMDRRCLIVLDGFFEYHHFQNQTIPYYIERKDGEPIIMAGIWDKWELKDENIVRYSCSILTTEANSKMAQIHNNPKTLKRGGARMPLILPDELSSEWLVHEENPKLEKDKLTELMLPYAEDLLNYTTVRPLQGKNGVGNSPLASEKYEYGLIGLP